MCNCIETIERKLTKKMLEKYNDAELLEEVKFQNVSVLWDSGIAVLNNPVLGRVRIGKRTRKYEVSMLPTYCPFCGKLIEQSKQ